MEKSVEKKIIISGNKSFIKTTYNDITVIMDENQYFNASKICSDNKVRFIDISRLNYWKKAINRISSRFGLTQEQLVIQYSQEIYSNKVRGTYIHKKLLNCLCYHINEDYANKVDDLLDAVNEINELKAQKFDETIKQMNEEINELKTTGKKILKRIVPVNYNPHLVYVLKMENKGLPNHYKIVYDSNRSNKIKDNKIILRGKEEEEFEIYKTFLVPGSKNFVDMFRIKDEIKRTVFESFTEIRKDGSKHKYLRLITKNNFEKILEKYKGKIQELESKFE